MYRLTIDNEQPLTSITLDDVMLKVSGGDVYGNENGKVTVNVLRIADVANLEAQMFNLK